MILVFLESVYIEHYFDEMIKIGLFIFKYMFEFVSRNERAAEVEFLFELHQIRISNVSFVC